MSQKPEWLYKQSAVIPYFVEDGVTKIVLITSRKRKKWIIPKGVIEYGLSPQDSAAKEAFEEAGITGVIEDRELGIYRYEKWDGICTVRVYSMRVEELLEKWEESALRNRLVVGVTEAMDLIENVDLKVMIKNLWLSPYEDCL